jgi:hypothetical protein
MVSKRCGRCKEILPLQMFYNMTASPDGKGARCKPCDTAARKESRARHPVGTKRGYRDRILRLRYNITLADYERMFEQQGNSCKICGTTNPLGEGNQRDTSRWKSWSFAVDHCHTTGKIRGLLCNPCNRGLGFFRDSPELLQQAVDYLEKC